MECPYCQHPWTAHLVGSGCTVVGCSCSWLERDVDGERLEAVPVPVVVAAVPGWHAVVVSDTFEPRACPIVAWAHTVTDGAETLEPFIYGPVDDDAPTVWRPSGAQWERVTAYLPPGMPTGGPLREAMTRAEILRDAASRGA
jgi:hypothetical protein